MFSGQKLKDWETWTGPEEAVATRPPDRIDGPDVEYENSCWMATVKRLIARKGDEKMLQDVYGQIRQCLLSFGSQFAIDQFALLTSCRWAICFRYLVSIFSDCWLGFQLIGYLVSGGLSKAGCDLPLDALRRVGRLLLLLLASTATSTSLQVDKVKIFFQGLILFFTTWPPCICCEDIPGINCWFDIIDWKKESMRIIDQNMNFGEDDQLTMALRMSMWMILKMRMRTRTWLTPIMPGLGELSGEEVREETWQCGSSTLHQYFQQKIETHVRLYSPVGFESPVLYGLDLNRSSVDLCCCWGRERLSHWFHQNQLILSTWP